MIQPLTRRGFLRASLAAAAASAALAAGCSPQPGPESASARFTPAAPAAGQAYLAAIHGQDPEAATRAAIQALGGIERFVRKGHEVLIKPNICVDYHPPEYAATTNPLVVAALVKLCLEAGAKRVRVMDAPFGGSPESAYKISGIGAAVAAAGGVMEVMSPVKFVKTAIPDGKNIQSWEVYRDALEADVLINVPIAKHHSLARLSLGTKNLFGLAANPPQLHSNLAQRAADLLSLLRPTLSVVDATRILVAHGPTGGSLDDVRQTDTVIASHDPLSADAYAATLFGLKGADIPYLKAAAALNLGVLDLSSLKIEESNV